MENIKPFTTNDMVGSEVYGLNSEAKVKLEPLGSALRNEKGLVLGKCGAGKGFTAKRELVEQFNRQRMERNFISG